MALDKFQPYLFVSAGEQSNKYLTPTITDGIAQFQAQRAQSLAGLTVRIGPIQEGTGDPSMTNIRPISGRTGLTVTRAGKNLLPITLTTETANGITAAMQTDGTVKVTGTATNNAEIIIGEVARDNTKSYAVSGSPSGGSTTTYRQIVRLMINDASLQTVSDTGSGYIIPTTLQPTATGIRISIWVASGQTVNLVYKPMVEFGNTVTPFEPYRSASYPISWNTEAGTIYGGTLDAVSGVLTVTHVGLRLTSENQTWASAGSVSGGTARYYCTLDPACATSAREIVCSHAVYQSGNSGAWGTYFVYNGVFAMKNGDGGAGFSSLADFKTWLDANNLQVVYPLATPLDPIQLSPTDVRTLAGFNQVYSDAGPVIDIQF